MRDDLTSDLARYRAARDPAERQSIEAAIWHRHGTEGIAFVLDMSGFSRLVRSDGLVAHLARIDEEHTDIVLEIERGGGQLVKRVADNCYAVFSRPDQALSVAKRVLTDLRARGSAGSVGLAHGSILLLDGDFFGDCVNVASKLGEDTAGAGEIIAEDGVCDRLPEPQRSGFEPFAVSLSGLTISAHRLRL